MTQNRSSTTPLPPALREKATIRTIPQGEPLLRASDVADWLYGTEETPSLVESLENTIKATHDGVLYLSELLVLVALRAEIEGPK